MPKIKKLLGSEKEIWVDLNKENYQEFFKRATKEKFVWFNGREIDEKEPFPFCISIMQDGTLGRVPCFQRFGQEKKPKIIPFSIIN